MRYNKIGSTVIAFFLSLLNMFGQIDTDEYTFQTIDIKSGLSNNIIYGIHKDRDGFVWIATENGLNRYNGYDFKTFLHNASDSTSISSNVIRCFLEDNNGNLWIGTNNGLNLYQKETESFKRYFIKSKYVTSIFDIKELLLDKKGRIWFNTRKFGHFNPKTEEFKIVAPNNNSYSVTIEKGEKVWIASHDGELICIDVESEKVIKEIKDDNFSSATIMYEDESENLWLPFTNTIIDGVKNQSIPILPNKVAPVVVLEINSDTLLIGTNDGLFQYKPSSKELKKIVLTTKETTLTQQVRSLHKDKDGGFWVGTLGGVYHYDPHKTKFNHTNVNDDYDNIIMGMHNASDAIYVNVFGKGVYRKAKSTTLFEKINLKSKATASEVLFVWDIEEISESDYPIWMSTNQGLICYNPKQNSIKKIKLPLLKNESEVSFSILNTDKEYVLVSSHKSIYKVSKKENKLHPPTPLFPVINKTLIQKIIKFNNHIFVATEGEGLFSYNTKTKIISKLYIGAKKDPLNMSIWDMYITNNVLWIGTNQGLYRMDANDMMVKPTAIKNHIVYSIGEDHQNKLWLGSEKGLLSYDIHTEKFIIYNEEETIKNFEFNRKSVLKTDDNKLWFGGTNGITVFDPKNIKSNPIKPQVYITEFKVITTDSTYSIPYADKKVELPWNQNTIELAYVALNYTNSSKNQYKYQLKGYDLNWVVDNTLRKAKYTQLNPGEYTFQIIAANNDGLWNTTGDQVLIKILPPYWKTWWFYTIIGLCIISIIWSIHKYKLKKALEVELIKLRIANDLHDDIGSGLSGIALTSDVIEQQLDNGDVNPQLINRITKKARHLAANLDDIVWLINPEKETLYDFLIRSKTMANESIQNSTLNFEEDISDTNKNLILNVNLKRNLLLFLKEAINNIVKHAKADNVSIHFTMTKQVLSLKIIDDGCGFNLNNQVEGNGLASMRNRAELIKGKLSITSKIDSGTHIHLNVKIP